MTHSLLQRTMDIARASRGAGISSEPVPTGRRHPDGFVEYVAGDGYVYASAPSGKVYLGEDSLNFAAFVQQLRLRGRALDLGSGSGLLAARLARTCAHVTAVDNSSEAAAASRATLLAESRPDRFDVVHGDLFEVLKASGPVDAVVANLPFVPVPDGIAYSRHGAGGPTGLGLVERVLTSLPGILTGRSALCLKIHCAFVSGEPLAATPIRRFLEEAGHAGCIVINGDVPMGFRTGQSALNASPLNPGHPDLLGAFDRHYSGLGESFVSIVVVTETAEGSQLPGELTVVDQRPMPSWSVPAQPASLPRVLRQYGVLTARMPEGYAELGTSGMIDDVADHAEDILRVAVSGASLWQCAQKALPGVADLDPIRSRGYLAPIAQLCRASRIEVM